MPPSLSALIVVGASTGGPDALRQLLHGLGTDLDAAVVIAQHLPDTFTVSRLAAQLAEFGGRVMVARDGAWVRPNAVVLARPGHDLALVHDRDRIRIALSRPESGDMRPHPNVDHLFESTADLCRAGHVPSASTRAIVLSGMGRDGARGACRLARLGAVVRVQSEASSSVWGMPRAVIEAASVRAVEDPGILGRQLRRELLARVDHSRAAS